MEENKILMEMHREFVEYQLKCEKTFKKQRKFNRFASLCLIFLVGRKVFDKFKGWSDK